MSEQFNIITWFDSFVLWIRDRRIEVIDILSDCAAERYLNCLTAYHLRLYGRTQSIEGLWARCEWNNTDISIGVANKPLYNENGIWNKAWEMRTTGDLSQIECKLLYAHQGATKCLDAIQKLGDQLTTRRAVDHEYEHFDQRYYGMV